MNILKDKKSSNYLIVGLLLISFYFILLHIGLVFAFLHKLYDIVSPFIVGLILAYILNIPMTFLENKVFRRQKSKRLKKVKRIISIILSILIILFVVIFLITLIIPQLINLYELAIQKIPSIISSLQAFINRQSDSELGVFLKNLNINLDSFKNLFSDNLNNIFNNIINYSLNLLKGISDFIISLIFSIYVLASKEKLINLVEKILYKLFDDKRIDNILKITRLSNTTFKNFITGQLIEASILGTLSFIGMVILGIPYAGTIGVLIGVTAIIPIVGALIATAIGAVLIVTVSPVKAFTFVIFLLILQQVENNIIYPKVVGSTIGLPDILVLVAVTIGGSLFGIPGMIIGLPIVSIIYTIVKENFEK